MRASVQGGAVDSRHYRLGGRGTPPSLPARPSRPPFPPSLPAPPPAQASLLKLDHRVEPLSGGDARAIVYAVGPSVSL